MLDKYLEEKLNMIEEDNQEKDNEQKGIEEAKKHTEQQKSIQMG